MRRGTSTGGTVLALTALLLVLPAARDQPHRPADPPAGPNAVVSLGDSYISGEGGRWRGNGNTRDGTAFGTDLATVPGSCNAQETSCRYDPRLVYGETYDPRGVNGCDRSPWAEIAHVDRVRLASGLQDVPADGHVNFACSGATAQAVVSSGFKGQNAQVDDLYVRARSNTVRLVVLSVGGNDIEFGAIVENCIRGFTRPRGLGWHCNKDTRDKIPPRIEAMKESVRTAVRAVRATMLRARYTKDDYRLVLQSYPSVLPTGGAFRYPDTDYSRYRTGGCPFYDDDATWAHDELLPALTRALGEVAREESGADGDVDFLDLSQALAGHEVCAREPVQQAEPGYTLDHPLPEARSEWARFYGGYFKPRGQDQETLHPNAIGQKVLGRCLRAMAVADGRTYTCPPPSPA